jgi:Icc protein
MRFSFAHISDHHLLDNETDLLRGFSPGHSLRRTLEAVAKLGNEIDFLLCTGDVVEFPTKPAYKLAAQVFGSLKMPVYFQPGNHDDRDLFYKYVSPERASDSSFNHKGVRFIGLELGAGVNGDVQGESLRFLRNNLSGGPTILYTHHQLVPIGAAWLDAFLAPNIGELWTVLEGSSVLATISGHVHISYEEVKSGIAVYGTRSTAFQFARQDEPLTCLLPPHIRVLTIEEGIVSSRLIEVEL